MTKIKQKVIAGILSGAMIFGGGLAINSAQARNHFSEHQNFQERHERHEMTDEQLNEFAQKISERYGVNQAEVLAALQNHNHFEDVRIAAKLSKLSGKSFSEVMAMKVDWKQVAEKLGLTHEQIEDSMKAEMLEGLAERSKLDQKTVESLLKDGYHPHDITCAGIIANESGKNVKSVFSKRKINNSWDDVAKEFGVDLKKVMKPDHERGDKDRRK